MSEILKVALLGTGKRSWDIYAPLLAAMSDEVELVAVWGRREEAVRPLAERCGVPGYTELARLARETKPDIAVISVTGSAHGEVGMEALRHGMHLLVETPFTVDLAEGDAMIELARSSGLKIEIAEQFHRRPLEQIKLKLIAAGLFGRVYSSFNDFCGHGYHGVSVIRSYLGFDARPVRVTAAIKEYPLAAHYGQISGRVEARNETQQHAVIEFEGGRLGIFHWTSVGYDSPLRWWRSSRFLAERGMGITEGLGLEITERLSLLSSDGRGPQFVTIQREWERVDGGALRSIRAHTGDPGRPTVTWENPFATRPNGLNPQWHDDEIGVAGCIRSLVEAIREDRPPSYGAAQGRLDQEIVLAIERSAASGGAPVELPLEA